MRYFAVLVAALGSVAHVAAWGGFGHITIAYLASEFVAPDTRTYFQTLLNDKSPDYLASVATWADSIRYTKWGHFTGIFHFIDAKDDPPNSCTVDMERDCKTQGCVVTAIQNYTSQLLTDRPGSSIVGQLSFVDDIEEHVFTTLSAGEPVPKWLRAQAAKFVIHFVSDIHQPLHTEDVARGGNGIRVTFGGTELNLHHVWDSSIAEKMRGGVGRRPYPDARRWAGELADKVREGGEFEAASREWIDGMNITDPIGTALGWAREANALVCSHVLPEGPKAIVGKELLGDYYANAIPVIELQVAKAGVRLAAWLDLIASEILNDEELVDEL